MSGEFIIGFDEYQKLCSGASISQICAFPYEPGDEVCVRMKVLSVRELGIKEFHATAEPVRSADPLDIIDNRKHYELFCALRERHAQERRRSRLNRREVDRVEQEIEDLGGLVPRAPLFLVEFKLASEFKSFVS
jgi:hypothetical protein